jgi:molecular chaperone GrpE
MEAQENANSKSEQEGSGASPEQVDELTRLKQQVETLQREKDELFQKLQRLSADYVNFQKRVTRQIEEAVGYEKEAVIKSLLPAIDNFDQALANAEKGMAVEPMLKGVQIVHNHFLDILRSHGVEIIESRGKTFDPSMHEAILQQSDPASSDGVILDEFQKGYTLSGRVIRPAKVVVNRTEAAGLPPLQDAESSSDETTDTE